MRRPRPRTPLQKRRLPPGAGHAPGQTSDAASTEWCWPHHRCRRLLAPRRVMRLALLQTSACPDRRLSPWSSVLLAPRHLVATVVDGCEQGHGRRSRLRLAAEATTPSTSRDVNGLNATLNWQRRKGHANLVGPTSASGGVHSSSFSRLRSSSACVGVNRTSYCCIRSTSVFQ